MRHLVGSNTFVAAACVMIAALSHGGEARAAGAAYQVDTAEVSEVGSCKVESWISAARNHDAFAAVAPACVVNLYRPVELSAQFARARSDGEWVNGIVPKFKTNLIPSAIGSWGVALTGTVAYDVTGREIAGYTVTVPATLRLSNVVRINVNAGWLLDRPNSRHFFTYGAGVDWRTADNVWTLTGEVFGLLGSAEPDNRGQVEPRFQLGIRWRPIDRFNIDLIYGRNLYGENANWLTVATIIRFPAKGEK